MRARRRPSDRVARRRALLADFACAVLLAVVAITVAPGVGAVGVGALLTLAAVLAWIGVEKLLTRQRPH